MARATRNARRRSGGGLGSLTESLEQAGSKADFLKVDDGDVVILRVIDTGDDFKDRWCHRVPVERDDGKEFKADVPCLDQKKTGKPCPGCKDDLDRRLKFWCNVIVRGDEDAKNADDRRDKVQIWSGGVTIAKRLDKLDTKHDIGSRDIELEREGSKMEDTKYTIDWAEDEATELSDEDEELKKKRHDLSRYTKIPAFDDFYKAPGDRGKDDDEDRGKESLRRGSAFKRRDKTDDEGGRRTGSRRGRSSSSSKPEGLKSFGDKKKDTDDKPVLRRRRAR